MRAVVNAEWPAWQTWLGPRHDRYKTYFGTPVADDNDLFSRFMFAQSTVNLSWEVSVELYIAFCNMEWPCTEEQVVQAFKDCRSGLHLSRGRAVAKFSQAFAAKPKGWFAKKPKESWPTYRERVMPFTFGLGRTKVGFTCELMAPFETTVVCLDRHMLRTVFGVKDRALKAREYCNLEHKWVNACRSSLLHPGLARLAYWDHLMGYETPTFWTDVLKHKLTINHTGENHGEEKFGEVRGRQTGRDQLAGEGGGRTEICDQGAVSSAGDCDDPGGQGHADHLLEDFPWREDTPAAEEVAV